MKILTALAVMVLVSLGMMEIVHAQGGGKGGIGNVSSGTVQADQIREQDRDRIQDPATHDGDEPDQDRTRLQDQDRLQASTTIIQKATNSVMLREVIEERERELNQVMASSAPRVQNMVQNENRVRLAVHALLASEDLLGGIGMQVREIARNINNSLATTSTAEKNITSRSFFARLFFGGDKNNAEIIEREMIQNQNRVEELQRLLDSVGGVSSPVRQMLEEQLRVLEEEQERLRVLAEQEKNSSGIFSWRF